MNLRGTTALITGGGTGIGAAIATALSSAGVRLMIAGRRRQPLEQAAKDIAQNGGSASFESCDVRRPDQCASLVKRALTELGHIDILVNNAGVSGHGRLLADHSPEDWEMIMDTNLKSAFLLSRLIIPHIIGRGGGHIVNISSISGVHIYKGESIYGMSKHALNAMTDYITEEYGGRGIKAVAICPGLVHTDMGLGLEPVHLDRLLTPQDIAGAVLWTVQQRSAVRIVSPIVLEPKEDPWDGRGIPMRAPGDDEPSEI